MNRNAAPSGGNPSHSAHKPRPEAKTPHPGGYNRSAKRQAHHADAHAEDTADAPSTHTAPTALQPLISRAPGQLITRQRDLDDLLARLLHAGSFAYDSEFIGEASYAPKLCLIQIATTTEIALVDPLADLRLDDFWKLLADPAVEKIVHAGQQDIEPVVRFTGRTAARIFDTQIAAGFAGLPYPVALSKLVLEMVGAKLGKTMTFTQWDARPLSHTQLRYAADDVRYLPALRHELGARVEARRHSARAAAEFDALCEPTQYRFDPDRYIHRVRGSGSLTPAQLRILRELVIWRDDAARRADVPARAYLKDEVLIDLCRSPAKTRDKLAKVRNLPRPVEVHEGDAIIAATMRGLAAPPLTGLPDDRDLEPSPTWKFQADALWSACQAHCHAHGIDPQLVTSRQEIGRLAYALAAGKPVPHDVSLLTGWRKDFIGDLLHAMLGPGGELRIRWQNGLPQPA